MTTGPEETNRLKAAIEAAREGLQAAIDRGIAAAARRLAKQACDAARAELDRLGAAMRDADDLAQPVGTLDDRSREECTRDVVFLFQVRTRRERSDRDGPWRTERVFLTRDEGNAWGRRRQHHFPHGWRVYGVPAEGSLAAELRLAEAVRAAAEKGGGA